MDQYDVAQICKNGHVINSMIITHPDNGCDFCPDCGAKSQTICGWCKNDIKGESLPTFGPHYIGLSPYKAPNRCSKCGMPYPWSSLYKIAVLLESFILLLLSFYLYMVSTNVLIRTPAIVITILITIVMLVSKHNYKIPRSSLSILGILGSICGILRFCGIDLTIVVGLLSKFK
ncbi:MAG: hypothetical protein CVU50_00450 [Candidatus Cloacimonetes bacterium HGW-Cloacimonetes-3]|jgi:hypothetical protein|nr:MAG: hypothetical protein CVU50_00450 [Candidatus Cloacimonetes bacterium HGW-Cloacimonetes-3]